MSAKPLQDSNTFGKLTQVHMFIILTNVSSFFSLCCLVCLHMFFFKFRLHHRKESAMPLRANISGVLGCDFYN